MVPRPTAKKGVKGGRTIRWTVAAVVVAAAALAAVTFAPVSVIFFIVSIFWPDESVVVSSREHVSLNVAVRACSNDNPPPYFEGQPVLSIGIFIFRLQYALMPEIRQR